MFWHTIKTLSVIVLLYIITINKTCAGIVTYDGHDNTTKTYIGYSQMNSGSSDYSTLTAEDNGLKTSCTTKSVTDQVVLYFDPDDVTPGGKESIIITVKADVAYYNDYNNLSTPTGTIPITLIVNYDGAKGISYNDKDVYKFSGAYKTVVSVTNVSFYGGSSAVVTPKLRLASQIEVERYYDYSSLLLAPTANSNGRDLTFSWTPDNAEYYDIEWVYVNDYDGLTPSSYLSPSSNALDYNFRLNATRVRESDCHFSIPMVFEHGYIVYRVRSVWKAAPDFVENITGPWSLADVGSISSSSQAGVFFNDNNSEVSDAMNWQYTANFAEEGKSKVSITYFDGTMRKRQSITRMPSETTVTDACVGCSNEKVVVQETMYDELGRAAIQALPAPVSTSSLAYKYAFNQNNSATIAYSSTNPSSAVYYPYSYSDFSSPSCSPTAAPMSTVSGASAYYSTPSVTSDIGQQSYLPDAKKYPFSQTVYAPDNTGRIYMQGGVGPDHQVNITDLSATPTPQSHVTKYLYGTPFQDDLDQLFGSEAGKCAHYKKNMVVDANGQVSISYLDAKGNVIATALAGNNEHNVDALSSKQSQTKTYDLLAKNELVNSNTAMESSYDVNVSTPGDYTFNYQVLGGKVSPSCVSLCPNCVYDLTINVTNECGQNIKNITAKVGLDLQGNIVWDCATNPTLYQTGDVTVNLGEVGVYTITKTLAVDQHSVDQFVDRFLTEPGNTCVATKQSTEDGYTQALSADDICEETCSQCLEKLNNLQSRYPDQPNYVTAAELDKEFQRCYFLYKNDPGNADDGTYCTDGSHYTIDVCDVSYQAMLQDVSPGGQYGQYSESNTGSVAPGSFPLSVYNTSGNSLKAYAYGGTNYTPDWRHPVTPYTDKNGKASLIVIHDNGKPDNDGTFTTTDDGEQAVTPEHLTNFQDFKDNWNKSWAKSLVFFHPEYPYYEWCVDNAASNNFDQKLNYLGTFSEANTTNLTTFGGTPIVAIHIPYWQALETATNDPFFAPGGKGASFATDMQSDLDHYKILGSYTYSLEQMAIIMVHCASNQQSPTANSCAYDVINGVSGPPSVQGIADLSQEPSGILQDQEWNLVKSMYEGLKQKYVYKQRSVDAIAGNYYNECFNNPGFDLQINDFYKNGSTLQPCNAINKAMYATKVPRFPSMNQLVKQWNTNIYGDPATVAAAAKKYAEREVYDKCGKCPIAVYLENTLNSLAKNGQLTSTTDLSASNNYLDFIVNLEDALSQQGTPPIPAVRDYHFNWNPTVSQTDDILTVTITQSNPILGDYSCTLTLQTGESSPIDWAAVNAFGGIHITQTTGEVNDFTITATYLDANQNKVYRVVSGHISCLNLNCSPPPPPCRKTQLANELMALFNKMMADGTFFDASNQTERNIDGYNAYLSDGIKAPLGGTAPGGYTWQSVQDASDPDKLDVTLKKSDGSSCTMTFAKEHGSSPWSDVLLFNDLEQDPNDPTKYIIQGQDRFGEKFSISVSMSCYQNLYDCSDPSGPCSADENTGSQRRDDLEVFFNNLIKHYNFINAANIDPQYIPTLIMPQCSSTVYNWTATPVPPGIYTPGTLLCALNCCTMTLSTDNQLALDYNDVVYFSDLKANSSLGGNVLTHNFKMNAHMRWGAVVSITGVVDCFMIANCISCPSSVISYNPGFPVTPKESSNGCNSALCGLVDDSKTITIDKCHPNSTEVGNYEGTQEYNNTVSDLRKSMRAQYIAQCLNSVTETFTLHFVDNEFHYTLYYYDQANTLVKTVPPAGVSLINLDATYPGSSMTYRDVIKAYRNGTSGGAFVTAQHKMVTTYKYNSQNKPVAQTTPDAGTSTFYYDNLARLIASQNAKQKTGNKYSYTLYDALNRIVEVGEAYNNNATNTTSACAAMDGYVPNKLCSDFLFTPANWTAWINDLFTHRSQITRTTYDIPLTIAGVVDVNNDIFAGAQQNLRGRVSSVTYQEKSGDPYDYGTHYTYDVHGYVSELVQENRPMGYLSQSLKRMSYDYDLISGKVNYVYYQKGQADQLTHKYTYDDQNRLKRVYTSRDGVNYDEDVNYHYYDHGALAREELGDYEVQGIDYAYTLQGWLKGVNSNSLNPDDDMGGDFSTTNNAYAAAHSFFARDAFGFTLSYYNNANNSNYTTITTTEADYKPVTATTFEAGITGSALDNVNYNLYNGNIRHMVTSIGVLMPDGKPQATQYHYDQLNRIDKMDAYSDFNTTANTWNSGSALVAGAYSERFAYDANGNITTATRYDNAGSIMDQLTYSYMVDANGNRYDNRLVHVNDASGYSAAAGDIKDEGDNTAGLNNYSYDDIGNLTQDVSGEIANIDWNVYGKIRSVTRMGTSAKANLEFRYGPDGNRVAKIEKVGADPTTWKYTYYVRDAQGNVMATYSKNIEGKVKPTNNTYSTLLNTLRTTLGSSLYAQLMGDVFYNKTWFINGIRSQDEVSPYNSDVVQQKSPSDYETYAHGSLAAQIVTPANYTDAALVSAYMHESRTTITDYIYTGGSLSPDLLLQYFLSNNPTGATTDFLDKLNTQYGPLPPTGASAIMQAVYIDIHGSVTIPSWSVMIGTLTTDFNSSPSTFTAILSSHDISHSWRAVVGLYGYSDVYTVIGLAYGYAPFRSYLLSLTDPSLHSDYLMHILYADNPSLVWSQLLAISTMKTQLMDLFTSNDPAGFITASLVLSLPGNDMAANLLTATPYAYDISSFLADLHSEMTYHPGVLSPNDYADVLSSVYGAAGDYRESVILNEQDLYGSKRLGLIKVNKTIQTVDYNGTMDPNTGDGIATEVLLNQPAALPTQYFARELGDKRYELSNHLGNVLAVISDKKIVAGIVGNRFESFDPEVFKAQDYYAFGMPMPGRSYKLTYDNCSTCTQPPQPPVIQPVCVSCQTLKTQLDGYITANATTDPGLLNADAIAAYLNTQNNFYETPEVYMTALHNCKLLRDVLKVNGGGNYIRHDKTSDLQYNMGTGPISIEAWYYYDGGMGERHLIGRINNSTGYALVVIDGKPGLMTEDNYDVRTALGPALSTAGWYHLAAVRDGTAHGSYTYHVYVNGAEVSNTVSGGELNGNTDYYNSGSTVGYLTVGSDNGHSASGKLSEVRLYNRAISSTEVSASYNNGCGADPSNTTGMVLWDKLNEGIGQAYYVYDYSVYKNNGYQLYSGTGDLSLQHEEIDNGHAGCISTGTAMCVTGTPATCLSCKQLGKDLTGYTGSYTDSTSLAAWLNERYSYSLAATEWMHTIRNCHILGADLNLPGNSSGAGDDVNMGDHNQWHFGSGDFTVEAWVYPRALQTGGIVSDEKYTSTAETGFNLMEASDGSVIFEAAAQDYNSSTSSYLSSYHYNLVQSSAKMSINKWHHIVVLKVGNNMSNWKLYIDGKKIPCSGVNGLNTAGLANTSLEAGQGVNSLRIGSHYGGNNGPAYFNGKVKQVRLYGRAIKEEEIQLSYDDGCGADPEDKSQLVLWLPLNEKIGTTVHDLSSYGLTATTNSPYFEELPLGLNGCMERMAYCQNNASQNVADARNYRYAFNGKESDDETYGEGDEYDFGARIYDPRLGRWMGVDPLANKYAPVTPYNFALNNPIIFMDNDGRVVIGSDGKPVTYEKKDGKIEWSSNATADVQKIGNAMLTTSFGEDAFNKWQNAKTLVTIKVDNETQPSEGQYGETVPDDPQRSVNEDGQYNSVTVTIFMKSIENDSKEGSGKRLENASEEEAIGTVGTHEVYHNDKSQIKLDKKAPDELHDQNPEKNKPINAEINFRKEYHEKKPGLKNESTWKKNYDDRGYNGLKDKKK